MKEFPLALLEKELTTTGWEKLVTLCRGNGIRSLALFGSRLHGDARPDSDMDLLVEFEQGRRVTLLDMARLEAQMADVLGHSVDLQTTEDLSPYFRQDVTAEAQVVYAQE